AGDRTLMLEHVVTDGVTLDASDAAKVLQNLANLWGYEVALSEVDADSRRELKNHRCEPEADWIG
ncbi:MAG TPA: SpoVR family protein, partial [Sphingobium sp.]|nr:SpoVR family protein [Sphingobium sp.]